MEQKLRWVKAIWLVSGEPAPLCAIVLLRAAKQRGCNGISATFGLGNMVPTYLYRRQFLCLQPYIITYFKSVLNIEFKR